MEYKPLDKFYLNKNGNHIKRCKECHVVMNRAKVIENRKENGDNVYYSEPGKYYSTEQRDSVFKIMEALGWIYDEPTGIWNKSGIKQDGIFINFTPLNKPKKKPSLGGGRKIKSGVWNNMNKIVKMIEDGYTYNDVADTFCCSHTLIRLVVSEYKNGKRP